MSPFRTLALPAACLACWLSTTPAAAESADRAALGLHASYFGRARSFALSHRIKPGARVSWQRELWPDLYLGPALGSVVTSNENYAVSGVYALATYTWLRSSRFSFEVSLGLGAGYNAAILHGDLEAGFPVVPYGYLGVLGNCRLTDAWMLGVELGGEQITVIDLGFTLAHEF